ncbi:MAG: integrase [Clostridium sp.]|jgi:integrase
MRGLGSKVFKIVKNGKCRIGYERIIKFKKNDIDLYIKKFNQLKKDKIIIEGEFRDNKWIFLGKERMAYFYFSNEVNYELNLAFKMYIILKIHDEHINPRSILFHSFAIKFIIKKTNLLSLNSFASFKDDLDEIKHTYMRDYVMRFGCSFLYFYDCEKYKELIDILLTYRTLHIKSNPRQLPEFKSIILFDNIIEDFMNSCTRDEKEMYFPILLWWSVTKSIPMRPIEFSGLETNCIRINGNKYLLSIPKCMKGGRVNRDMKPEYRDVQITEELYKLINDFIEINDPLKAEKYLLNYDIYNNAPQSLKTHNRQVLYEFRENLGGTGRFYSLLKRFYLEIIEEKYKYKTISVNESMEKDEGEMCVERIRPGDTRHFAICNLYLQGFNPLTIARLAGHETLNTQLGYARHLNTFADSQVKVLTNRLLMLKTLGNENGQENTKRLYKKSIFFSRLENPNAREVEDGICIDEDFPNNCIIGDCIHCDHYRMDTKNNKCTSKFLLAKSNGFDSDIKTQIKIIKSMVRNSTLNKSDLEKNRNINIQEQQVIGVASKKLQQAIVQKAMVDSYIFEKKRVEQGD